MKKSLLTKAKEMKNKKWTAITSEDTELVVAHLLGMVTMTKIQKVKGFPKGNSIYSYMFRALREGIKHGEICISDGGNRQTLSNLK